MTIREGRILARAVGIQKENNLGVTTHLSEINELKFGKKMPHVLYILALFWNYGYLNIYENCVVTYIFLFGFQWPLLGSAFSP